MRFAGICVSAFLMSSLAFVVGCTSNSGSAEKAMTSIVDPRVELVKAQNQLYETLASLDNLKNATGDLNPAYERFKTALANTNEQKKIAQDRAAAMRENHAAYEKKWEQEAAAINNPDVKSSAEERMANVRAKYDNIREIAQDCRKQYAILYTDLLDINRYLSNDLNAASLDKVKPNIDTAKKDGDALNARLNDLMQQMNQLTAELNPTGKVPEK